MPEFNLTISEPVSIALRAIADVTVAALNYAGTARSSASEHARDQQDRIHIQMYADWRAFLQRLGIVGAEIAWPPKAPGA